MYGSGDECLLYIYNGYIHNGYNNINRDACQEVKWYAQLHLTMLAILWYHASAASLNQKQGGVWFQIVESVFCGYVRVACF